MSKARKHIGSSFDDFLKDEGVHAETQSVSLKRVLSWQLAEVMKEKRLSRRQMAKKMQTSRSQVDRILDPENDRVQLDTLAKAAEVLGHKLRIELV